MLRRRRQAQAIRAQQAGRSTFRSGNRTFMITPGRSDFYPV